MWLFQMCLMLISVSFVRLKGTNITEKRCKTQLRNGTIKVHCCDNQEYRNGHCLECEVGFKSDVGESCQPCRIGSYGRKCGDNCQCEDFQICHHVEGCVNLTFEISSTKISSGYNAVVISTERAKTSEILPGIIGSIKMDMVIYIICTSGVTFLITLCFVALNRHRKKRKRNFSKQPVVDRDSNGNTATYANDENDGVDRVYDIIDESQMIDMPNQSINEIDERSIGLTTRDYINLSNENINPYQPMVPDPECHDYNKPQSLDEVCAVKYINHQVIASL